MRDPASADATRMHVEFAVPANHPALAGHFPGHPIVPGAMILEEVASRLEALLPECQVIGLLKAKFLSPLPPGEVSAVHYRPLRAGQMGFECRVQGRLIATGTLQLSARGTPT